MTRSEIEKLCKENETKLTTTCPKCGGVIIGYPATSRYANINICSPCGVKEAMDNFEGKKETDFEDWFIAKENK